MRALAPLWEALRSLPGVRGRLSPKNRPGKKKNEARLLRGSRQPRQGSILRPRVVSVAGWVPPRLELQLLGVQLLGGRVKPPNLNPNLKCLRRRSVFLLFI